MKNKHLNKIKKQIINVGIELNKLESLSRILTECLIENYNLKSWDAENLSYVLGNNILNIKRKVGQIEESFLI